METVIKAENVSKRYFLRQEQTDRYQTLSGKLSEGARSIMSAKNPLKRKSTEEFWALQDVGFQVEAGDRVGIIGRNGAGKSTLLKILSRIVMPTKGKIEIKGRISSLLEVGTGFHPELSGRENIFLNGSILGMTRKEIRTKFDEIVAFAEIERFLDTPVKRYSSGMYVRLAFSVAAHLEPEILIVDEVLAVGDYQFQKKCLGKMGDVASEGRTILFVSHNMDAIQKLCNKGVLLDKGKIIDHDNILNVVKSYLDLESNNTGFVKFKIQKNQNNHQGNLIEAQIRNDNTEITAEIAAGKSWSIRITFLIEKAQEHFIIGIGLQTISGFAIRTTWSSARSITPGTYEAIFTNNDLHLSTGKYQIAVGISNNQRTYHYSEGEVIFNISETSEFEHDDRLVNKSSGLILNQGLVELNMISK